LWMTICLLQFVLAFQRNDNAAAGFWLALGCIKPQLMLVPCALLLGARRWRALGSGVVYGGILFGVSSGVLGWHIWLDWVRQVGTLPALFVRDAYNLRGALVLLLGEAALPLATGITSGLLLLVLAGTIWQGRRIAAADAAPQALGVGVVLLLGLLVSPHLLAHDTLLVVVPGLLFYSYLRAHAPTRRGWLVLLVVGYTLLFFSFEPLVEAGWSIRIPVLLLLVLAGWMTYEKRRLYTRQSATNG
ncbi:MAG: DUF2029 domain-containing protein, partial [Chloroflexaceae bacterium]|nr:DUF2029 domain-containing protein [Chloroflexaceae bacterium]